MNNRSLASNIRKSDNPCFGCVPPDRYPGCHAHCPKRAEYVRKNAEIKARREAYIISMNIRKKW